jgi:DNA-binding winged helix-turn-helix (wHTH) protein
MIEPTKHFYDFGPFRFDPEERVLHLDGMPVPLAPKVAETLSLLVQNAGHLVEKDELVKKVWPDTFVEEGNLNKNIFLLRRVLGQCEGGGEYIETVPRRGYRFVASVTHSVTETTSAPAGPLATSTRAERPTGSHVYMERCCLSRAGHRPRGMVGS